MGEIFVIMLGAVLTENFIFSKLLGVSPFLRVSDKPSAALGMGIAMIFVMSISSAATWIIYHMVLARFGLEYLKLVAFVLIIALLVQSAELFVKKYFYALHQSLGIYLPLITTNCAVLGAALLIVDNEYNLINSVLYGVFVAVGFTLAIVIFAGVRERLHFADPPAAFRDIPIVLISAGLLAMAFWGFRGIEIA